MKSEVDQLLEEHRELNHLDMAKVVSHTQRETDEWMINTLMLEGYDVPFRYRRKKRYQDLKGARVNLTYYAHTESIGGIDFEVMNVVRVRKA